MVGRLWTRRLAKVGLEIQGEGKWSKLSRVDWRPRCYVEKRLGWSGGSGNGPSLVFYGGRTPARALVVDVRVGERAWNY